MKVTYDIGDVGLQLVFGNTSLDQYLFHVRLYRLQLRKVSRVWVIGTWGHCLFSILHFIGQRFDLLVHYVGIVMYLKIRFEGNLQMQEQSRAEQSSNEP